MGSGTSSSYFDYGIRGIPMTERGLLQAVHQHSDLLSWLRVLIGGDRMLFVGYLFHNQKLMMIEHPQISRGNLTLGTWLTIMDTIADSLANRYVVVTRNMDLRLEQKEEKQEKQEKPKDIGLLARFGTMGRQEYILIEDHHMDTIFPVSWSLVHSFVSAFYSPLVLE